MNLFNKYLVIPAFFVLLTPAFLAGQHNKMTTEEYIDLYKDVAIQKMQEYGIPASITLAQGILESGSGNSRLAQRANNHFGIKCHNDWDGKRFYMDDDARHECFRKYKDPADSYRDHSLFLTQRDRYAFLFDYDIYDYKKWAHGLKKAGYATNPKYPQLLIGLIDRYDLAQYDKGVASGLNNLATKEHFNENNYNDHGQATNNVNIASMLDHLKPVEVTERGRKIYENNGAKFIRAHSGDSYYELAVEFDIYSWQLYKYNETDKNHLLKTNEIVYLEKKKRKADKAFKRHIVKYGESLREISQLYGVRLSRLMKMNKLSSDRNVPVGTVLRVR